MSKKHTTMPAKAIIAWQEACNRQVYGVSRLLEQSLARSYACVGNRNKHKQRHIPSSLRTKGRIKRWLYRRTDIADMIIADDETVMEVVTATYQYWRDVRRLGHNVNWTQVRKDIANASLMPAAGYPSEQGHEDMGRDGWKAEGGCAMTHPDLIAVAEGLEEAAAQCSPQQNALCVRLEQGAAAARRAEQMRLALASIERRLDASNVPALNSANLLVTELLADISKAITEGLK